LENLLVRVLETNQYIRPSDLDNCKAEWIDDKTIQLEFRIYYSFNNLILTLGKEGDRYQIHVKDFKKQVRNYHCDLYILPNKILENIGGDELRHIGQTVLHPPLGVSEPKPTPPKLTLPQIRDKRVVSLITTFNGLEWTKKSVESISNLRTTHRLTLVVSDNCSTDGTREWCERQGILYYSLFGRRPVAAGINLGLRKAWELYPDYILVMNNDVMLTPDYLDKLIDLYEVKRGDGCLLITGYVKNYNYASPEIQRINRLGLTEDMKDFMDTGDFSCFLITPETLKRAGFFDENYEPRYVEDNDYLHKVYAAGGKAFRTGQTCFYHEWGTIFRVQPTEKEYHIPTFKKNMLYYKEKWGDFPKGAERHTAIRDITQSFACGGGQKMPKDLKPWVREEVALIQMGHIGDVIDTLPIAKEIHDEGEEVVWLTNYRFEPLLKTVKYIKEVVPFPDARNSTDTYFGKKFQEAVKFAEEQKFRRILIAQITPKYTDEFYRSNYPKNIFTAIVCLGRLPKSLKPEMPIVPFNMEKKGKYVVGLILVSHSLPIAWDRSETLDSILQNISSKLNVEYVNLGLEHYEGKTPVRELGKDIAIHQLSGAINSVDLLLTVDTGAYYPGLVTKTPIIHMLPKPKFTNDPKAPPKYPCEGQGFSQFSEVIDYWYEGNLQDLDNLIIERLTKQRDLRTIKRDYSGMNRTWLTL